jgi:hypothetical protein
LHQLENCYLSAEKEFERLEMKKKTRENEGMERKARGTDLYVLFEQLGIEVRT